jgi:hypothetical protein
MPDHDAASCRRCESVPPGAYRRHWMGPRKSPWHVIADGPDLMRRLPRPAHYCTILAYQPGADGTPACYRGPLYAEWDGHAPVAVLAELRTCLQVLQVEFDLTAEALRVWHSGGRGYHLTLPAVAIGAADGHPQLPLIYRAMVERLWPASIAPSLDRSIYSMGKGRMWRLPSRRRPDTGRYKVPLAAREVLHGLGTDLEARTGHPRRGLLWPPEEELCPCADLVRLYEEVRAELERRRTPALSRHAPSSKPGVLYALFAARGWLGRELSPGRWAVICPWREAHTTGMPGDSSTVLFGPGEGEELGWWHCSHAHCAGRGLRDVLAVFTPAEFAQAREAAGLITHTAHGLRMSRARRHLRTIPAKEVLAWRR